MNKWVRLPTTWMLDRTMPPLNNYRWSGIEKSDNIAALMLYICIAQQTSQRDDEPTVFGMVSLSYSQLCVLTSLSRAKVSAGINILSRDRLVDIDRTDKTNTYALVGLKKTGGGWAKLPAENMYDKKREQIKPFYEFKLRQRVELDALKLFLLLIALRDNKKNHATPSYRTITQYTGIPEAKIRAAISLLVNLEMIHVQKYGPTIEKRNNFYRIIGIDNNKHGGNIPEDVMFGINKGPPTS